MTMRLFDFKRKIRVEDLSRVMRDIQMTFIDIQANCSLLFSESCSFSDIFTPQHGRYNAHATGFQATIGAGFPEPSHLNWTECISKVL